MTAILYDFPDKTPEPPRPVLDEETRLRIWLEIMGCRPGEQPPPARPPRRRLFLVRP